MVDEYDAAKNLDNISKHGVSFEDIYMFEWETALITEDVRHDYGEQRFIGYGFVNKRLHVLVWTKRNGSVRPISFRKANKRERRFYDQEI